MAYSNLGNSGFSLTQDSDEVKEMHCEHCDIHDNKYEPASGFCVDCIEFLCDTCLKYHRRFALGHSVQDKDSMPQDFCFEKCSLHPNQIIKLYCEDCRHFFCTECKFMYHHNCANVSHVQRLVQGIEESKELKELTEDLDKLSEQIKQTEEKVNHNLQEVVRKETKILAATKKLKESLMLTYKNHQQNTIDTFTQKMEETIAKLKEEREMLVETEAKKLKEFEKKLRDDETSVTNKVAKIRGSDQKELQSIQGTSLTLKNDLKTLSSDLVQQQKMSQRCKLFMTMKKGIQETEKLKKCLNKLKGSNDIHNYIVKSEVKEWDVVSLQNAKTYFSYKELPISKQKRYANFHSDIQVKELQHPSLCLLNESTFLVADFNASLLIFFRNVDVGTEPYSKIKMPFGPWCITKIENNKVAVTFPETSIVKLITFSEYMAVINTDDITVGEWCRGIAYSNNNLIVSHTTRPGMVQILDMSGNVLKCFDKDCNGQPLFNTPYYLTLSPDNTTIYVSDCGRNTVTSMTLDGKVKAIYRDGRLKAPYQLTVDESGAVYVCGYGSQNVHQLSSDLMKVKILLDDRQGMYRPVGVAYCQKNSRLCVGVCNSRFIKMFNLSLE